MEFNSPTLIYLRLRQNDSDNNLTLPLLAFWMTESRDAVQNTSPRVPMEEAKIASPSHLHMMLMRISRSMILRRAELPKTSSFYLPGLNIIFTSLCFPNIKGSPPEGLRQKRCTIGLTFLCLKLNKPFRNLSRRFPLTSAKHIMLARTWSNRCSLSLLQQQLHK